MTAWLAVAVLGAPAGAQGAANQAYVANAKANTVSVIDTSANLVTATIDVGLAPADVAISADGTRAFVINTGSSSVSVIDTVARAVAGTVALGDVPAGLALSPAGDRLYVIGAGGLFQVIDTGRIHGDAGNPILASFPAGDHGGPLVVTRDGRRVYIAAGGITVVDTATNALLPDCAPALGAHGFASFAVAVAMVPDGTRAYVSLVTYSYGVFGFRADGEIAVLDLASNAVTATIPLFAQPGPVAFTADGSRAYATIRSYWAETGYGAAFLPGRWVAAIDTATSAVVKWIDLGSGDSSRSYTPAGIAVTPDRRGVYVGIPASDAVAAIDTATSAVTVLIGIPGGPSGVAAVPDAAATPRAYVVAAVDDVVATPVPAAADVIAAANVLANDTIDGTPAAIGNVTLSLVASTSPGVTLDTGTGAVRVAAGTAVGAHAVTYRICDAGNALNCDEAVVTLVVRAASIVRAVPDRVTAAAGARALSSVIANDTLNGLQASFANVSVSQVSGAPDLALNGADGSVQVANTAAAGEHVLVYRLCEAASPANCDQGTVTVLVVMPEIRAAGDSASAPRSGATAIANVLANDTLDGSAATLARVTLTRVSSSDPGLTLNVNTGAVSVARGTAAGAQTLVYRVCETVRPGNCSDAAATVTVSPYVVSAAADTARASSKTGGMAIVNVLSNDTVGGERANATNANLSLVSLTPSEKQIRLNADGTVDVLGKASGATYALVYQLCEAGNPGNCARATLTLALTGK